MLPQFKLDPLRRRKIALTVAEQYLSEPRLLLHDPGAHTYIEIGPSGVKDITDGPELAAALEKLEALEPTWESISPALDHYGDATYGLVFYDVSHQLMLARVAEEDDLVEEIADDAFDIIMNTTTYQLESLLGPAPQA